MSETSKRNSNGKAPTVSVIVPTHNRATLLPRCLDSILGQTFRDFELIIIDDCSTDDTLSVLERYAASDSRVRFIQNQTNLHAPQSRNVGIKAALGEWVAFNDDDDEWMPDKLELQLQLTDRFAIIGCLHARDNVPHLAPHPAGAPVPFVHRTMEEFFFNNVGFSPTKMLVNREHLNAIGGFDQAIPGPEGIDLVVRLMAAFGEAAYVDRVLAVHYSDHGHGRITDRMLSACERELKKNRRLRSRAARRLREAHLDLMRMDQTPGTLTKAGHLLHSLRWFDLGNARHHMKLYRNMLILNRAEVAALLSAYRSLRYR